ncbi:unnamed protein product [Acanthoscelides obtectus]|uniref:Uncharacterized protein n=1 Tax=Acanthoscelides obtectus TaxID=200917 RepID=A0A9P0K037_ACAOB|nr:unnamed protein product [Acanthoscelides obtectus]CAK1640745.1 hypothetical protein AOBTE_LOCUS11908 [Acanthoscelides obtectus]
MVGDLSKENQMLRKDVDGLKLTLLTKRNLKGCWLQICVASRGEDSSSQE